MRSKMLLVLAVRSTAQRCSSRVESRIRCLPHHPRFASPSEKWGLSRPIFRNGREYSSSSRGGEKDEEFEWAERETVDVRCGGSGFITVDIFNPSLLSDPRTPLLVYFPPAGTHLSDQHPPVPSYLLTNHSALARINYRWNIPSSSPKIEGAPLSPDHPTSTAHPFPTPIHDTLHAYTYLLERFHPPPLLPNPDRSGKLSVLPPPSSLKKTQRLILLYGSYLGGTIATSLALTESYASKTHPVHIAGLISKSGVYDWVEAGTTPPFSDSNVQTQHSPSPLTPNWDLSTLISHRQSLFPHPGYTFDAFASPTLFFRTAGSPVPKTWRSLSPSSSPASSPEGTPEIELDIWDSYDESDGSFLGTSKKGRTDEVNLDPVARKANLKFPPKDSGLKIPRALFLHESGGEGEEKKQAEEMARLMRRSIVVHEFKERAMWDEEVDPGTVSRERVRVKAVSGGDGDGEEDEEGLVREWIEEALG